LSSVAWFKCGPDLKAAIVVSVETEAERLIATEGRAPFALPRSAAAAHEAGHAIVGAAAGDQISRVEIWRERKYERLSGLAAWAGYTHYTTDGQSGWTITPDTPSDAMQRQIWRLLAGVVGEGVLDPAHYLAGSSLDEVAISQVVAAALHEQLGLPGDPEETWRASWGWTVAIIRHNEAVARELAEKLHLMTSLQGRPLAAILARVRPLPETADPDGPDMEGSA
jgi:hypothetical protein